MRLILIKFCLLIVFLALTACGANVRSTGLYHIVKKGQTLYTISKVYGIDEIYLARINKISDPTQLRIGTRIYIPGAKNAKKVPITVSQIIEPQKTAPAPKPSPVARPKETVVKQAVPERPVSTVTKRPAAVKKTPVGKGSFIWPVKGKLVKKFNSNTAIGSKGVEISARSGTPVSSAAAGKVIYSGDGISGYGNLLIVRHDDSFFTVYGYNQKNLVEAGAFVSKGEKIALSGRPPSGGVERIYFEIRYGKKPVNPIHYLP
jgi:lipoprotein NlpD